MCNVCSSGPVCSISMGKTSIATMMDNCVDENPIIVKEFIFVKKISSFICQYSHIKNIVPLLPYVVWLKLTVEFMSLLIGFFKLWWFWVYTCWFANKTYMCLVFFSPFMQPLFRMTTKQEDWGIVWIGLCISHKRLPFVFVCPWEQRCYGQCKELKSLLWFVVVERLVGFQRLPIVFSPRYIFDNMRRSISFLLFLLKISQLLLW
jgi:hypothetical protein